MSIDPHGNLAHVEYILMSAQVNTYDKALSREQKFCQAHLLSQSVLI